MDTGVSRTTMHCPPLARHSGVATRAAILCPYDTHFYDVMGLSAFFSLLLVGFCWRLGRVRVNDDLKRRGG